MFYNIDNLNSIKASQIDTIISKISTYSLEEKISKINELISSVNKKLNEILNILEIQYKKHLKIIM